jgi:hypothetical protein
MAKPSRPGRDRRAIVEQMRREQKQKERRRTVVVLTVCVVVAVVIVGLAVVPLLRQDKLTKGPLAELGVAADAAGCRPVVKKPATGNQEHRPVGTRIDYSSSPPAFGPHWPTPAPFSRKFYTVDDRPELEYLVHNLEHGYTLLWYDSTVAGDKDGLAVVKAIAGKFEGNRPSDKFIAVPWTAKDGEPFPKGTHLALTHWSAGGDPADVSKQKGVWEYCAKPSGAAVHSFMSDYPYTDSPEPQGI